jgi:hypothetical protein
MKVEIKNRWSDKIILCGEYESIKECLEKNRSANLSFANLYSANLCSANLYSANLYSANLYSANLSFADLYSANLCSANLSFANLRSADLSSANLYSADLSSANLTNIKNYSESHEIWIEIIRQQKLNTFTEKQWAIIGQVWVHRLCWETIKKRYGKKIIPIFKKLTKVGFGEFEKRYKEIISKSE